MANVRKFLDLSVAHLNRAMRDYLNACAEPFSTFGLSTTRRPTGWFMYATDDPACYDDEQLPPHIRAICAYARANGCEYVLFDCDAELDPNLPVFEDEGEDEDEDAE